jgi:hypothetical protein
VDALTALVLGFLATPIVAAVAIGAANALLWLSGVDPHSPASSADPLGHPAFVWRDDGGYINGVRVLER